MSAAASPKVSPARCAATVVAVLAAAFVASDALAHPISLVQADVFVARDRMTAKFEVFLEDLHFFQGLEPDAQQRFAAADLERAADAHARFLAERFLIQRTDGSAYEPTTAKRTGGDIPPEGVSIGDLMKHSLTYEVEYDVQEPPEFLTFEQRFVDEAFRVPSNVTLRVWQQGAEDPLERRTLSPRKPFSTRLDWSSPNPPATATVEAWDAWMENRRQSSLGISSYSSTYAFLYIEPAEVRHEILVPLLSLESESWRVPRTDPDRLTPEEQTAARDLVVERFAGAAPVRIDGELREPVVDRVDFYGIDFSDFAMQAPKAAVGSASARIGIILRYPCERLPGSVELEWKLFGENLHAVETVVFAPDKSYDVAFNSIDSEAVFRWENPAPSPSTSAPPKTFAAPPLPSSAGRVAATVVGLGVSCVVLIAGGIVRRRRPPMGVALILVAAACGTGVAGWSFLQAASERSSAKLPDEEAMRLVRDLHGQIYDAFRLPDENARYERLDASLAGDLVREAYLEISDRLRMQEQGGALLRIDDVTPIEGTVLPATGLSEDARAFVVEGEWTVSGRVEHWGHVHSRTNAYDGRLLVEPQDGLWKIARLELLGDERVESETTLREF